MKKIILSIAVILSAFAGFSQSRTVVSVPSSPSPSEGDMPQRRSGQYVLRSLAQVKTDLGVSGLDSAGVYGAIGGKAPIASPTLTGLVTAPRLSLTGVVNGNHLQAGNLGLYWTDFLQPLTPSVSILSDNMVTVEGITPQAVSDGYSSWLRLADGGFDFVSGGASQYTSGDEVTPQSLLTLSPTVINFFSTKGAFDASGNLQIDGDLTTSAGALATQMAGKLNISDTAAMFAAHPGGGGGTVDATPTDGSTNAVQSNGVYDALAGKLNISDTSTAFGDYRTALNARVKYSDTSTILSDYRTALNTRAKYSDTSTFLSAYQTALNARMKYSDTSTVLSAYQTALNARAKYSDTSTILSAYRTALNLRLTSTQAASQIHDSLDATTIYFDTNDFGGTGASDDKITVVGKASQDALNDTASALRSAIASGGGGPGTWTTIKGTTDVTRTSTNTLADDDALVFTCESGKTYTVRGKIWFEQNNGAPDLQYATAFSGTTSSVFSEQQHTDLNLGGTLGGNNRITRVQATQIPTTALTGGGTGIGLVEIWVTFTTTSTGTFSFQWAPNNNVAFNLIRHKGSYIEWAEF